MGVVASLTIDRGITNALHHPELAGVTWDASVTPANRAQTGRNISPELARQHGAGKGRSGRRRRRPRRYQCGKCRSTCILGTSHRRSVHHAHHIHPGLRTRARGDEVKRPLARPRPRTSTLVSATPSRWAHRTPESGSSARHCSPAMCTPNSTRAFGWHHDSSMPSYPQLARPGQSPTDGVVAVRFAPGISANTGIEHLQSELGPLATDIEPSDVPDELENLRNVHTLPEVLAAFLGLIAVAALGSVLLSCARRRAHDFAVLRSLGMTRGNIRTILNSQGTAIGLFGLVVGIPLGIVVGRLGWRAIAARVPLSEIAPFALVAILLIIPVFLVAANILALLPGRVARCPSLRPIPFGPNDHGCEAGWPATRGYGGRPGDGRWLDQCSETRHFPDI